MIRMFMARFRCAAVALSLAAAALIPQATAAEAEPADAHFEAIRAADMRLAAMGWRLARANSPLCDELEPGTGIQLHTMDQFEGENREAAQRHFGFETPVAVEGVVHGTPAELAGVRSDDSVLRIGTIDLREGEGKPGTTDRLVSTQLAIAALPPGASIEMELLRKGQRIRVSIQPVPICRSRFELRLANDFRASADGAMVQVSSRFFDDYPEAQAAAVVAHEFSHNVLRHRVRLESRGVSFGMLSGFGGNVKYFRQTELEADLLSLYLLANADYPLAAAPAFWRDFGPRQIFGFLASRSHPDWKDRVATMQAEIARIEASSVRPIVPTLLSERDTPLSGDWQALLVRAR